MARYQVCPGTVVHLSYQLFDAEDALVESSDPELPLAFLYGFGQVAPAIETALGGAELTEKRVLRLAAGQAFGERDAEAILELDASEFPPGTALGDEFEAEDEEGDGVSMKIVEVDVDNGRVWVDTNHPLAGQSIRIEFLVEGVRPATAAEIAQAEEALAHNAETEDDASGLLPVERLLRPR
jgi:FKBP-type peptidyl-prolyl cis-trans isomerase SlyD